jgi:DNA-binding transcriptional MerR regulator
MRIGELAAATGTTSKTLRFYEDSGLLRPAGRTASGYREYTEEAVARLDFIRRGRGAGLTLAQIREVLDVRDRGHEPCQHVEDLLAARLRDLDAQIANLRALRAIVAELHEAANSPDPGSCQPEQVCRDL